MSTALLEADAPAVVAAGAAAQLTNDGWAAVPGPRLFGERLHAALRSALGDGLVLLPEHSAHRDGFGGWHKDTDMFERAGRGAPPRQLLRRVTHPAERSV